jgi:DNA-binding CsgD family transcriptional regulator
MGNMMDIRTGARAPESLLQDVGAGSDRDERCVDSTPGLLTAIVDQLALGILVADRHRTVIHANRAARAALRGTGVRITPDAKLEALCASDAAALERALGAAAMQRRSLIAVGSERQRLSIAVQPLTMPTAGCKPHAMLLLSKPVLCDSTTLEAFARAHRLTPAETAVLDALCGGYRAKEVAMRTRSSVPTVRGHLRSIYVKTGARNLQALLARVASLPSLADPDG